MKIPRRSVNRFNHGFTLIEVMLVILLIGVFMSIVSFNPFSNRPEDQLEAASARFTGIFNIAAEYGLLNNLELGLVIEDNSYEFVVYEDEQWTEITEQEALVLHSMPEGIEISLELDDLPVDDQNMLSNASLFQDEDDFRSEDDEDEEKKIVPQVLLLSGGDFTSFRVIFSFTADVEQELEQEIEYHVSGLFTLPLTIKGHLYHGEA
mgnify:CR=1 FL=1